MEAGDRNHVGGPGPGEIFPDGLRQAPAIPRQHGLGQPRRVGGDQLPQPVKDGPGPAGGEVPEGLPAVLHGFDGPQARQQDAPGLKVVPGLAVGVPVGAPELEVPGEAVPGPEGHGSSVEIEAHPHLPAVGVHPGVHALAVAGIRRIVAGLGAEPAVLPLQCPGRRVLHRLITPAPEQTGGQPQADGKRGPPPQGRRLP